jgi:hypothetical protein
MVISTNGGLVYGQSDLTAIRYNHSNYTDLNPAYVGLQSGDYSVAFTYQGHTGVRNAFRNVYVNGFLRKNNKIAFGLNMSSEIAESYSTLTQTDLAFVYTLFETEEMALYAAGEMGMLSYVLQSTPYSPGLSRWRINGDYGLMFQYQGFNGGLALRNAFSPKVDLFNDGFRVRQSLNLFSSYQWSIADHQKIKTSGMIDGEWKGYLNAQGLVEYKYSVSGIGLGYNRLTGLLIGLGIEELDLKPMKLDVLFMYNKTIGLERLRLSNQFEMTLRIYR